jgi:hypothetical protein
MPSIDGADQVDLIQRAVLASNPRAANTRFNERQGHAETAVVRYIFQRPAWSLSDLTLASAEKPDLPIFAALSR